MKDDFLSEFLEKFNSFRKKPTSLIKEFNVFSLGVNRLSKVKTDKEFVTEIENIFETLKTLPSMKEVQLNSQLTEIAKKEIMKYGKKYPCFQKGKQLKGIVPEEFLEEEPVLIMDVGVHDGENLLTKIIANKKDKKHLGKETFFNSKYTQIGLAHRVIDKENVVAILLAYNDVRSDNNEAIEQLEGDLSALKKAFDLYDVYGEHQLRMEEVLSEMKLAHYDDTDPVLYNILQGLAKETKIASWPVFASYVNKRITNRKEENGLRDIFNIFIDNPKEKSITYDKLSSVNEYLNLGYRPEDLHDMLGMMKTKGEMNFEDFCEMMKIEL